MGDRNRLRILKLLQSRDGLCVCEIQDIIGVMQSTTSRHLRILEDADLIYSQKDGKWTNFHLNTAASSGSVREALAIIAAMLNDDAQILRDVKKLETTDRNVLCSCKVFPYSSRRKRRD